MKPAPFSWHGPESVAEAVAVLAENGDQAKVLAGGQSLIPVLAMRLAAPAHIVDINRIGALDVLTVAASGVTVGALARHSRVEHDRDAGRVQPLLAQALRLVAHPDHPQPRHHRRLAGARRSGRGDDGRAGAVRRNRDRGVGRVGDASIDARRFLSPGRWSRRCVPTNWLCEAFFPAIPPGRRHGLRRDLPPARRLRAVRGGRHRRTRLTAAALPRLRCAYLSVSDTPLVLDLTEAWAAGEQDAAEQARARRRPADRPARQRGLPPAPRRCADDSRCAAGDLGGAGERGAA